MWHVETTRVIATKLSGGYLGPEKSMEFLAKA
jgi:hypothetical protein